MVTDCPSCRRQFRIYAQQLSAAKGLVQCGFCGKQFNALDSLYDGPQPRDGKPGRQEEPQFDIPGNTGDGKYASNHDTNVVSRYSPGDPALSRQYDPLKQLEAEEFARQLLLSEPRRSPLATGLWTAGVIMLLLAIGLQWLWFNRDTVLARYPEYMPLAKQLCERLHCKLIRDQDISSIVLLNRDVRNHPRFNNVLLVNVTVENQSDQIQPYPDIQMVLYDTAGNITGYRQFMPGEYLDPSVTIEDGMAAHQPLHVVLEVTDTTESAVSFEFRFL